jgi:hypothetical protein
VAVAGDSVDCRLVVRVDGGNCVGPPSAADPDPESGAAIRKDAGSGSALNQYPGLTLMQILIRIQLFTLMWVGFQNSVESDPQKSADPDPQNSAVPDTQSCSRVQLI